LSAEVFTSGQFKGVSVTDPFALAAMKQNAITVTLGKIPWPAGLVPTPIALGNYKGGESGVAERVDTGELLYRLQHTICARKGDAVRLAQGG
jgi:hypothetical protein